MECMRTVISFAHDVLHQLNAPLPACAWCVPVSTQGRPQMPIHAPRSAACTHFMTINAWACVAAMGWQLTCLRLIGLHGSRAMQMSTARACPTSSAVVHVAGRPWHRACTSQAACVSAASAD